MLKVGGFPEFLPIHQKIFDNVVKVIKQNYEVFGYKCIQTPSVEKNEILLAKSGEEISKQIFGLYGLAQGCEKDIKNYSLRFDLTVPFARYVLDYENNLSFPFKRYQIQPVRRGERQQKGRFKEFWQADIDVIWKKQNVGSYNDRDYNWYDIEVIGVLMKVLNDIFNEFNLSNNLILRLNSRKIINGFLEYLKLSGLNDKILSQLAILLDKYHKMSPQDFKIELEKVVINGGFSKNITDKVIKVVLNFIQGDFDIGLQKNNLFLEGLVELEVVFNGVKHFLSQFDIEKVKLVKDFSIIRGLDYYTGIVFETFIEDINNLGSICSGGRYDNLTGYINRKKDYFNGVGGSIGITRFFDWLKDQVDIKKYEEKYLFLNFGFGEKFEKIFKLYTEFIKQGKKSSIYPHPDKLKKQFRYADKAGYKYVVIMGDDEIKQGIYKIKNMELGDEKIYTFSDR